MPQTVCDFSAAVTSTLFTTSVAPLLFFFPLLKPDLHNLVPLTQLFGALAVAGQFPQFYQSIKVAFSSYSYSWRRENILGE